ncbi:MAG: hypothetical protein K2P58_12395 [Hyphomonadaceae bacterium]|nr:hypothetical protein [Hyphomonadaceae bacterium]
MARFLRQRLAAMRRQQAKPAPIRLRENARTGPAGPVIDADYAVVGRKRGIVRTLVRALLWVLVAALIGFLVPPLWIFIETIGADASK